MERIKWPEDNDVVLNAKVEKILKNKLNLFAGVIFLGMQQMILKFSGTCLEVSFIYWNKSDSFI